MASRASILCPYCGHTQVAPDRCANCGGMLEPLSRMATQIAMGPWFIRDTARPFQPGCSYEVLRRLIAAGKIKPGTPLRGPTTHQFWALARRVPGVARLVGFCYHCGVHVKPHETRCPDCAAPFDPVPERNALGLSTRPAPQAMLAHRRLYPELCPFCGHHIAPNASRCASCRTVFAPAENVTPISMGPWYVRDRKLPFRTGMSYQRLVKHAAAGSLKPNTVLRGPTTQQFWTLASQAPGAAHLVGFCHVCHTRLKGSADACPACYASFTFEHDRNHLGLTYPTQESAEAAQRELDELVKQREAELRVKGITPQYIIPLTPRSGAPKGDDGSPPRDDAGPAAALGTRDPGARPRADATAHTPADTDTAAPTTAPPPAAPAYEHVAAPADEADEASGALESFAAESGDASDAYDYADDDPYILEDDEAHSHHDAAHDALHALSMAQADTHDGPAFDPHELAAEAASPTAAPAATSDEDAGPMVPLFPPQTPAPPTPGSATPASATPASATPASSAPASSAARARSTVPAGAAATGKIAGLAGPTASPQAPDEAGAAPATHGALAGAAALAQRRRQANMVNVAVLLMIGFIVVMAVIAGVGVVSSRNGESPKGGAGQPPNPATNTPEPTTPEQLLAFVDHQRAVVYEGLDRVKKIEAGSGIDELRAKLDARLKSADQFYQVRNFTSARQFYDQVAELISAMEAADAARTESRLARSASESAMRLAAQNGAAKDAPQQWAKAQNAQQQGQQQFDQGQYPQALATWKTAEQDFNKARTAVAALARARTAKKGFEDEATRLYSRVKLDALGGALWTQAKALAAAADKAITDERYDDAVKTYNQAQQMLPDVFQTVMLEAGLNYFAFSAGRLTTRILLDNAGGQPFTDAQRSGLKKLYGQLRLPANFFDRVPADPGQGDNELAQVIMLDAAEQIESNRGKPARSSFNVGIQFVLIERLLRKDVLTISTSTKLEIIRSIDTMTEAAKEAGYGQDMFIFLREFRDTLDGVPDRSAVLGTRKLWKQMGEKLDNYETAMKIVAK